MGRLTGVMAEDVNVLVDGAETTEDEGAADEFAGAVTEVAVGATVAATKAAAAAAFCALVFLVFFFLATPEAFCASPLSAPLDLLCC